MQTTAALTFSWSSVFVGLLCSFISAVFIVSTKKWHGRHTIDSAFGIQKFHTSPTPRIGGLALVLGLCAAWWFLPEGGIRQHFLGLLLLGALPAFAFGLAEDITKRVSVRARLLATAFSGLLAAIFTGYWVNTVHVPLLDNLFSIAPFAILFTAFAVAGVANSVNIVDGFNGLAGGVVVLMLLALAALGWQADDKVIVQLALLGAAATIGFLMVNFPRGHLFLGDAGAYFLGYYVAMLAVMLTARHPEEINPWAMLLVCAYPVIETLFSIYRRMSRKRRHNPGSPDASHLHSLLYRRFISRKLLPYQPAWKRNAATSPLLWMYSIIPMAGALVWPDNLPMVLAWLALSVLVYLRLYRRMLVLSVFFRRRLKKIR